MFFVFSIYVVCFFTKHLHFGCYATLPMTAWPELLLPAADLLTHYPAVVCCMLYCILYCVLYIEDCMLYFIWNCTLYVLYPLFYCTLHCIYCVFFWVIVLYWAAQRTPSQNPSTCNVPWQIMVIRIPLIGTRGDSSEGHGFSLSSKVQLPQNDGSNEVFLHLFLLSECPKAAGNLR